MKITGRNNVRILPVDWIAGVHYDEEIEDENNDEYEDNDEEDNDDHDGNEDNSNKPITQDEIDNLLAKDQQQQARQPEEQEANPTGTENVENNGEQNENNPKVPEISNQPAEQQQNDEPDDENMEQQNESPEVITPEQPNEDQRPARARNPLTRLTYVQQSGQKTEPESSEQEWDEATIKQKWDNLEASHNITHNELPNENIDKYDNNRAEMIARVMVDIHDNIERKGIGFIQQFGDHYAAQFSQ